MTSSVPSPTAVPRRRFATTRWSLIHQARQGHDTPAKAALEELCEAYWLPVYGFMRRQTRDVHEAQDWTQGFFASLLSRDAFADLNPEFGRFRSFLLAAARHFVSNERDRKATLSRGGKWFSIRSILIVGKSNWSTSWLAVRPPSSCLSDDGRWHCWIGHSTVCDWSIRTQVGPNYLRCWRIIWPGNRPRRL